MTQVRLKIWIIATGEPVPFVAEEQQDRFMRAGMLSEYFARRGYDTIWWTARFNHYSKVHRNVEANALIETTEGLPSLVFLESCGYQSHIGFSRLRDHWQMGRNFRKLALTLERPDLIFCSYPTVELAYEAVRFGDEFGIPVIVDVRDLWPDVIYERLKKLFRFSVNGTLVPYERMARFIFQNATSITAISSGILNWAQDRFRRPVVKHCEDISIYQFKETNVILEKSSSAREHFAKLGIFLDSDVTRFVWVGSIVPNTDADTLLTAIETLPKDICNEVEFVICGTGSLVERVKKMAQKLPHLKYGGWVNADQLAELLRGTHIGLLCYLDRDDFNMSIPNKVLDYLDGECRILTNLKGEIDVVCGDTDAILRYPTGDVGALREIFVDVAKHPEKFRSAFKPGREIFKQHFWTGKVLPEFEEFILSKLGQ